MDKLVVDEWILDHSGLLCAFFALIYTAAVVLIPLGLARGYVPAIYFGEFCLAVLVALLVLSEPFDRWLALPPRNIQRTIIERKERIKLLQVNNYTIKIAVILPLMFFVAFIVAASSGVPLQYVIATGGYLELAYFVFIPTSRYYVQEFLGMNLMTSTSSFASLAHLFLSRNQTVGLDYFRRAIQSYLRYLLQNEMTNNALTSLDTMILSFKAVVSFKAIPYTDLAQLANYFPRLSDYSRFSRELSSFQSKHRWVKDLGLAPRNPGWVGRNATVTLTVLGLIVALTVTDTLRNQVYTILTEATTGGLSQLISALVVYLGTIAVVSKAGASYSRRIPRAHIAAFRESA